MRAGCVRMVTLQGLVKNSRRMLSELLFDFPIDSIGARAPTNRNRNTNARTSTIARALFLRPHVSVYCTMHPYVLVRAVCLPDSVLAFSSHGVQGRHLKTSEVRLLYLVIHSQRYSSEPLAILNSDILYSTYSYCTEGTNLLIIRVH